jgi:hypothetical protein
MEAGCEYTEQTAADSRQGAHFQLADYAAADIPSQNKTATKLYSAPQISTEYF